MQNISTREKSCCRRCGGEFALTFFRISRVLDISSTKRRRVICIGCEQTERDTAKSRDRWRDKIRSTIRNHARKYINRGLAADIAEFVSTFGWHLDDMKHDAEHVYKNGCQVCHRLFSSMEHGLADLTLDVINPTEPPYYISNTKWICRTCNREKGRTPPHLWAQKLAEWRRWERRQTELQTKAYIGPLFEWTPRLFND